HAVHVCGKTGLKYDAHTDGAAVLVPVYTADATDAETDCSTIWLLCALDAVIVNVDATPGSITGTEPAIVNAPDPVSTKSARAAPCRTDSTTAATLTSTNTAATRRNTRAR